MSDVPCPSENLVELLDIVPASQIVSFDEHQADKETSTDMMLCRCFAKLPLISKSLSTLTGIQCALKLRLCDIIRRWCCVASTACVIFASEQQIESFTMAGQNPSIDIRSIRNYLLNNALPDALYQFLTPREALNLNNVALFRCEQADYNRCGTTCQSWQPPFPVPGPRHDEFETRLTYFMHPHVNFQNVNQNNPIYAAQLNNQCANRASYNTMAGPMEHNYCLLPHDHPSNNMHAHPNRPDISNEPLVWSTYKGERWTMWTGEKKNYGTEYALLAETGWMQTTPPDTTAACAKEITFVRSYSTHGTSTTAQL